VNRGKEYAEYNIQLDVDDSNRPIAMVRYRLAKLGARNINTMPIGSSIPFLKAFRAL